jgi:anti-sigma B factor antagonist
MEVPMQQSVSSCDCVCDVQPDRERVVVRLAGELDFGAASAVGATIGELLDAGFERVVVDLGALSFIDSAGIHTLVSAQRSADERRCALSVARGPRDVHRVFELTGTDSLFAYEHAEVRA